MTLDAWITLLVVVGMFTQLVRGRSAALTIAASVIALLVLGVIDETQALSGLSSPAPVTVAALYIIARAVERTGVLERLVRIAIGENAGGRFALLRLIVPSATASAFLNNTPIVAMLMPSLNDWSRENGAPPSRLLMPLSFGVILGGVVTTIGTSTNLVVSGLLRTSGQPPLGFFEISPVGLPVAIAGIAVLVLLAPWLLPDRESPVQRLDTEREFVFRMIVDETSELDGLTVEAAGLRGLESSFLAEIERDGEVIVPVTPTTTLCAGDQLLFAGQADQAVDLFNIPGLRSAERPHLLDLPMHSGHLFEAVVGPNSPLLGQTPRKVSFRDRYDAAILGIQREGRPIAGKLGQVQLRLGDTLLLMARDHFADRWRDHSDFILIAPLRASSTGLGARSLLVIAVTLGIVAGAGSGLVPVLHAALAGAVVLVATRTLTPRDALGAIDVDVLLVIAASFGVGAAIEASGLATLISEGVQQVAGGLDWHWTLLALIVATIAMTELISNNAAAALMYPIAIATAAELDADPRRFAIAIAVAASCSFLTPIGYQTNTMIYGPGGYLFGDYWRLGAPLTVVAIATILATA